MPWWEPLGHFACGQNPVTVGTKLWFKQISYGSNTWNWCEICVFSCLIQCLCFPAVITSKSAIRSGHHYLDSGHRQNGQRVLIMAFIIWYTCSGDTSMQYFESPPQYRILCPSSMVVSLDPAHQISARHLMPPPKCFISWISCTFQQYMYKCLVQNLLGPPDWVGQLSDSSCYDLCLPPPFPLPTHIHIQPTLSMLTDTF